MHTPIVVLTPVKNEEWILDNYIQVTSNFADLIIIADQFSSDKSREIASNYDKVLLIKNPKKDYDEAFRQNLLIDTARNKITGRKLLIGLDADEIMTSDSQFSKEWNNLKKLDPGTVIYFQKPDLFKSVNQYLEFSNHVPLGVIDDGRLHKANLLHSSRIPFHEKAPKIYINDIKFMHYAMLRMSSQKSKNRLYSALTNICEGNDSLISTLKRRKRHSRHYNYSAGALIRNTPKNWFLGWEKKGINIRKFEINKYYSQDEQLIELVKKHGEKKFWYDDIWHDRSCDFDLDKCRDFFYKKKQSTGFKDPFEKPPMLLRMFFKIFDFYIKKRYYS